MGKDTKIEWTDHTFNPWIGCSEVSPGCAHCYAAAQDNHRKWTPKGWGKGKPRHRTSAANWRQPLQWNAEAAPFNYGGPRPTRESEAFGWRPHRPRVFCLSLGDWLDEEVPIEWFQEFFLLILNCQHLIFQLLTKRPQNLQNRLKAMIHYAPMSITAAWGKSWLNGVTPGNIWVGASVENQACADERIPVLIRIPAAVRFLSCEPLLGAIDLQLGYINNPDDSFGLDWVIAGGESGAKARPMDPRWAEWLRDQCAAAKMPFFFKQWGEWAPWGFDNAWSPTGLKTAAFGREDDCRTVFRTGKKLAGRLLDGREWNRFPVFNQEGKR